MALCPTCKQRIIRPASQAGRGWRMLHGDAMDVLPTIDIGGADVLITDPPYNGGGDSVSAKLRSSKSKYLNSGTAYQKTLADIDWDSCHPGAWKAMLERVFSESRRIIRDGFFAVFSDWRSIPDMLDVLQATGFRVRGVVVWDKGRGARPYPGGFRMQAEFVIWGGELARKSYYGPGVVTVKTKTKKVHITEKPVPLMIELLNAAPAGCTVLDPFAGSASTGVAALRTSRSFVGIESVEQYFRTSIERLREAEDA